MNNGNDFENKNALHNDDFNKPAKAQHNQKSKKKKKHNSALVAASKYRSPVHAASNNSFAASNFDQMGTNMSFREESDVS